MLSQLAIRRSLISFSLITASLVSRLPVSSQEKQDIQQEVESVQSVDQVKSRIKELMTALEQCGVELMTGLDQGEMSSCENSNATAICEQVGMLDLRVDGKNFSGGTGWTESILPITPTDLALMKQNLDSASLPIINIGTGTPFFIFDITLIVQRISQFAKGLA